MSRIAAVLPRLALPALAAAALCGLSRAVPFDLLSYATWAGILLALLSLVALVRPAAWLWLTTRRHALVALCAGVAVAAIALAWPPRPSAAAGQNAGLDGFLPEYQAVEQHEARTRAPLARVVAAVQEVGLQDLPVADALMRIRALGPGPAREASGPAPSLLDEMLRPGNGFLVLDASDPRDRIYGMVGAPWRSEPPPGVGDAAAFRAFHQPGFVRVAFDFRVVEEPGGVVRLSTETRILGTDPAAQRAFARYWRLVYPGSAVIRRVWLDAVVRRAERDLTAPAGTGT